MSDSFKRVVAISLGQENPRDFPDQCLYSFRPGEEIVFNDDYPVVLEVEGYDGPEESRPVTVTLRRLKSPYPCVWKGYVNRLKLVGKPEMVIR